MSGVGRHRARCQGGAVTDSAPAAPPVVRAARGTERTARTWPTEAALRMLCNNLDPEVAERPADLVVYGGTGKAARDWPSFHAIVATLRGLAAGRDHAGGVRAPGRRAAHPRVGAAGADRQLEPGPGLGQLAGVPPAGGARADHVRPDDRRLVDLHRHPGHPAGHLRDVRRAGRAALRRHAARTAGGHRRAGWHGRCAAAGGDHERRRGAVRGVRPGPAAPAHRGPLPGRGGRLPGRRGAPLRAGGRGRPSRCRSGWSATPPRCCPSCCAAACRWTW